MAEDFKNKKLTDWANEPTIAELTTNLDDAEANSTKHIDNVARWLSNLYIEDKAKVSAPKGHSEIVPKLIRKQAEWRYSALSEPFLSTDDLYNVYPVTAGDVNRARQNALVLNNQFNTKLNKVKFIDDYVREAVDVGTIIVKVGWETEEREVETEEPIFRFEEEPTGQLAQRYLFLAQLRQNDLEKFLDIAQPGMEQAIDIFLQTGIAYIPIDTGEVSIITETKEVKNQPTIELLDTRNVIIDPSCLGDLDKAEFIAEKFKSSLSALEKDGNYHNLDLIDIEAASPLGNPDYEDDSENDSFNFNDKPRKQFIVHQYWGNWDIHGNNLVVPILVAWVNNTIIRMEENPFPDGKPPYILVNYMPVRRSVYGEPDGELLEDNQKIIGAVTRGALDLLGRSANSQTGLRKDLLDIPNRRKYNNGEDYEFNANVDPNQGIHTHKYPEIPQSVFGMVSWQNAEAESLSGVKAFSDGINGRSLGDSVGTSRSVLDATSKRERGILRRLAKGIIDVGRKIIAMNAEFLSEEETIRITDDEFVNVRRDDLAGNFDLFLAISTPEEDNKKAEELAFMLQTNGPNSDPAETRMIRAEIARLRKMPELAKRIEEYEPQPDPLAVKKAELEILHLQAQIAKEQALAAKHSAEAQMNQVRGVKEGTQANLNQAKVGTEQAKTRDLYSTADRKDLDFIEQESGVNQARDIEKIDRKGKVDNDSKFIDAALNASKESSQSSEGKR